MSSKKIHVIFVSKKTESQFKGLKEGKYESKKLYEFIKRAIGDLKENPTCGAKIPRALWPKLYVSKYNITNLWKYDLPNGWRLVYTVKTNEVMILNIILEWFSHKEYERRFKY